MNNTPHFVLFSGTGGQSTAHEQHGGSWYFVLESTTSGQRLEVSDVEVDVPAERLELLAVVRGLEALDQPSRVTLMTSNHEVSHGIRHGLPQWRAVGWSWQRFGEQVPMNHGDLWQRIDRAARIHRIDCRCFRFDPAHVQTGRQGPENPAPDRSARPWKRRRSARRPTSWAVQAVSILGRTFAGALHHMADWLQRVLPENQPTPHPMM